MRGIVLLLLALLAAAASAQATDPALSIDVHRLAVMMSQSRAHLATMTALPDAVVEPPEEASDVDTLVWAIGQYNAIAGRACRTGNLPARLCIGPYAPPWLSAAHGDVGDDRLRGMADEASARLQPLWEAICAKARRSHAPEPVCPME
ncbi:MAG TPA: hypothetical protein VMU08_07880 [Rhizomicrobium sp.]|nr:hypothetical protein [Rhizomicrobium sp.]